MRRILLVILCFLLPVAQGETVQEGKTVQEGQTLLSGTPSQNAPFGSVSDAKNNFFGFDIDIMGEICKRLKVTCIYKPLLFPDLFSELRAGKINLAIGSIIITDIKQENFIFSLPYLESNGQFIALADSSINTPDEIAYKRVGMRRGRLFQDMVRKIYKGHVEITNYNDFNDLLTALNNKTVDIAFMNAANARYWFANDSAEYKLIGSMVPTGGGYGIMANPSQKELIADINQALLRLEADGTYLTIYTRYFGG